MTSPTTLQPSVGHDLETRSAHNACSAVAGLPPEVLSMIFENAALSMSRYDFNIVNRELLPSLMCCKLFRCIALATPLIWSFVHFESGTPRELMLRPGGGYRASNPLFIARQFELSGSVDLRFHLEIEASGRSLYSARMEQSVAWFKEASSRHIQRCRELEIVEYQVGSFISILPLEEEMPTLRRLSYLGNTCTSPSPLERPLNAPNLCMLKYTYARGPWTDPSPNAQLTILPQSFDHNLEYLEAWMYPILPTELLRYSSTLPKLRFLRVLCSAFSAGVKLSSLEFPVLEALILSAPAPGLDWITSMKAHKLAVLELGQVGSAFRLPAFCLKSHFPLLDTFQMSGRPGDGERVTSFLSAHPTVVHISFTIGSTRDLQFLVQCCKALATQNTQQSALPHSKHIYCSSWIQDASSSLEFLRNLVLLMRYQKAIRVDWNDAAGVMRADKKSEQDFRNAVKAVKSRWAWDTDMDPVAIIFKRYEVEGS